MESPSPRTAVPRPYNTAMDNTNSSEVKLLEDRLKTFQAENALLGRTLRNAQAERQVQQQALATCQAQTTELQHELQGKDKRIALLQREVEELRLAGVKRDQHLEQSLVQRQELEGLVLDLQAQLAQLTGGGQDCSPPGRARALSMKDQANSPTLGRRIAAGRGGTRAGGAGSPLTKGEQAGQSTTDLREEISRLEGLYSAKLQLIQQQSDARVAEIQHKHSEAVAAAQTATREALVQLRQEVERQVAEAEGGLQRQLQQQDRVLEQLQKRCAVLESRLREARSAAAGPGAAAPPIPHRHVSGSGGAMSEIAMLRQQLVAAQSGRQQTAATVDAAAAALATHKQQAAESMRRLQHVRQELCSAIEQQHQLSNENAQLQQQALASATHLAAAESAIKDLRCALCDARERLLTAQSATVAEVLQLAVQGPQGTGPAVTHKDGEHLSTYVRVLEHALREADAREAALRRAVSEGQYLEDQARRLLAASRDEQLAMRKALVQQVQRVQAVEAIRLSDVQDAARAWNAHAATAAH